MIDLITTVCLSFVLLLFIGYLILFTIYTSSALFTWPPSIPTDRKTRKAMATLVAEKLEASKRPSPLILDLGSGFGHLAEQCALNMPEATIQGYEKFIIPFIGAHLRLRLLKMFRRMKRVHYYHKDFFEHAPVSRADAVLCFLLDGPLMDRMLDEVYPQLQSGVWLVCNGAKLPGITPDVEITIRYIIGVRHVYGYCKP